MKECVRSVLLLLMVWCSPVKGQLPLSNDTIRMTLPEAEKLFLNNNLELIAQKNQIDLAEAEVVTAKLYDNPELSLSNSVYNPQDRTFFDWEINAEYAQLIRLAGKRKKEITLAKTEVEVARQDFYDVMRQLRYRLRNTFYNIYYLQQSSGLYDWEINSLQIIVNSYKDQVAKGNIAKVDLLRVQSQLYTLQAERDNLYKEINDLQSDFRILIKGNPRSYYSADWRGEDISKATPNEFSYAQLTDTALVYRPDLKALNGMIQSAKINFDLQKANAKPDLTVSAIYQRLGGFVPNYNAVGLSMPLPFFNRNQGNIRAAKVKTEVNQVQYEHQLEVVRNEVISNYDNAIRATRLLSGFDPEFLDEQQNMLEQVTINFQKGNMSLLEFLDYYNAYKENILQLNQLKLNRMDALEQLNLSVGKVMFEM